MPRAIKVNNPCLYCGGPIKSRHKGTRFCKSACFNKHASKLYTEELVRFSEMEGAPTSHIEAKERGFKFYIAPPCIHGHLPVRLAKNRNCAVCRQVKHATDWELKKKAKEDEAEKPGSGSLMTSPYWFHLTRDWQPIVVYRTAA